MAQVGPGAIRQCKAPEWSQSGQNALWDLCSSSDTWRTRL